MNNFLIKELLNLHCNHCHGDAFGCRGCDKEERINEILNLYLKEPVIETVEEETIEEPVKVTKKPKNNKKK